MFKFFKRNKKKAQVVYEPPSLVDTLWYIPGINNNEPILKIDKIENDYVTAHFIEEQNLGKIHYQNLTQFKNCFYKY